MRLYRSQVSLYPYNLLMNYCCLCFGLLSIFDFSVFAADLGIYRYTILLFGVVVLPIAVTLSVECLNKSNCVAVVLE
jgi:hypothetical protein